MGGRPLADRAVAGARTRATRGRTRWAAPSACRRTAGWWACRRRTFSTRTTGGRPSTAGAAGGGTAGGRTSRRWTGPRRTSRRRTPRRTVRGRAGRRRTTGGGTGSLPHRSFAVRRLGSQGTETVAPGGTTAVLSDRRPMDQDGRSLTASKRAAPAVRSCVRSGRSELVRESGSPAGSTADGGGSRRPVRGPGTRERPAEPVDDPRLGTLGQARHDGCGLRPDLRIGSNATRERD